MVGGAGEFAEHKVVIQVSSDDPQTQKVALNNALNLQKAYGMDNVQVEVVAYGPGLSIFTGKSPKSRVLTGTELESAGHQVQCLWQYHGQDQA
jgi:hypothetical protein